MTKIQEELIGALIGLARSVDGRGEAAEGESQEFSSGDSNGYRPDAETHQILLAGLCAANPEKELTEVDGKEWIARVEAEKNRLNPDCAVCKGKWAERTITTWKNWKRMNRQTVHGKKNCWPGCFRWRRNCGRGRKSKSLMTRRQ